MQNIELNSDTMKIKEEIMKQNFIIERLQVLLNANKKKFLEMTVIHIHETVIRL